MIYEIEISEEAEADLRSIFEYILYELHSPQSAIRQLEQLEESIMNLDQMPERFHLYEKQPWHNRGLRIMPVDNYCVLYITDKEKALVTIIRVMYGGRDMDAQLKK
jgi:toxin ParE1/3/4